MSQKSKIFAIICIFTDEILGFTMMKTCKIILFCLLMSSVALSCGVARQTAQEREALVDAIEDSEFILDITEIMPFGYPSRASTGEYALRVDDETVTTRLPFIGDSRMPMMSSDEISIVFEKEKVDMAKDFSAASRGEYRFRFKGGKGLDQWTVNLQLFDSGKAYIRCVSTSGRQMSYMANVVVPKDED